MTKRTWTCSLLCVALLLVVVSCAQATPTPTVTPIATPTATLVPTATPTPYVNACAKSGLPFTPTPRPTRPTPTPTPTVTPGGPAESEAPPPIEVPSLANVPVPASAQYLIDALVSIDIHPPAYYTSSASHAYGLVVSADGLVLTVLDYSEPMERFEVQVPGMGRYDATIERVDPRTGATLLRIDGVGFPFASLEAGATVELGEPVVVLYRDTATGELVTKGGYGAPVINEGSKDTLLALLALGPIGRIGASIVNHDGEFLGMAGQWTWFGTGLAPSGPPPGPDRPIVKISSLLTLLEDEVSEDAISVPAAVAYHSHTWEENRGWHIDSPLTRELLAESARKAMQSLGGPAEVEKLGQKDYAVLGDASGLMLELVYAEPQQLRSISGEILGEARYVAFWWGLEKGEPDVVLCGLEPGYICGAFLAGDLSELAEARQSAPKSSRSMVTTDGHLLPGFPFRYPLTWDVEADKETYRPGEAVTFVVTIENHSDWPIETHYLPPGISIRPKDGSRYWVRASMAEVKSITVPAGETVALEFPWNADGSGNALPQGGYYGTVSWATLGGSRRELPAVEFTVLEGQECCGG